MSKHTSIFKQLIGAKVRTLYQHSETGTLVKPRKVSLPMPGPDWFIIQFDSDGKKLCIHRSMFVVRNEGCEVSV